MTKQEWAMVQDLATAYYRATGTVWKWPNRITLTDEVLVELYQEKGMNLARIGQMCGITGQSVSARLKKVGVHIGRNMPQTTDESWAAYQEYATKHYHDTGEILPPPEGCGRKITVNTRVVADMYVECGMSTTQIAEVFGCAPSTVYKYLKREGVKMRPCNSDPLS